MALSHHNMSYLTFACTTTKQNKQVFLPRKLNPTPDISGPAPHIPACCHVPVEREKRKVDILPSVMRAVEQTSVSGALVPSILPYPGVALSLFLTAGSGVGPELQAEKLKQVREVPTTMAPVTCDQQNADSFRSSGSGVLPTVAEVWNSCRRVRRLATFA